MNSSRRRLATALVPVALLVAGCGGGGDTSDERARTVTAPESEEPAAPEGDGDTTLTEAELTSALLTVQDLPTGYSAGEPSDDESTQTDAGSEDCSERYAALGEADEQGVSAEAEASFEGGLGVILEQGLESYEDEVVPQQRFDDVIEVLNDCPTFTDTDAAGSTVDFSVSSLSFPKLGDDTIAISITVKSADVEGVINFAVVRLGRNVMSVAQGGLTADAAVLEAASRKGLDKLSAVAG